MEDAEIIDLYHLRSETAIAETTKKYGRYCGSIAYNILHSREECEECVSDTCMKAWNCMPPRRPKCLRAFLGKITRNLALSRYERYNAQKRGAGRIPLALDELRECVSSEGHEERILDRMALTEALNRFLASLTPENRKFFIRRYWYFNTVAEIAFAYEVSESKVKMSLSRSRDKLNRILREEGLNL